MLKISETRPNYNLKTYIIRTVMYSSYSSGNSINLKRLDHNSLLSLFYSDLLMIERVICSFSLYTLFSATRLTRFHVYNSLHFLITSLPLDLFVHCILVHELIQTLTQMSSESKSLEVEHQVRSNGNR
jgi:hypothetical protein